MIIFITRNCGTFYSISISWFEHCIVHFLFKKPVLWCQVIITALFYLHALICGNYVIMAFCFVSENWQKIFYNQLEKNTIYRSPHKKYYLVDRLWLSYYSYHSAATITQHTSLPYTLISYIPHNRYISHYHVSFGLNSWRTDKNMVYRSHHLHRELSSDSWTSSVWDGRWPR